MATTFTTSTNGTILVIDGITYQYSSADNSWTRIAQPLNGTSSTFTVTNITSATSTNTGALQVRGGAGIAGDLYVGGALYQLGQQVLTTASVNQFANQTSIIAGTDTAVSTSTGAVTIWNVSTLQSVTGRGATTTNAISFANTTSSTSTTTGAVIITGGVGIGGDLYVGGAVTSDKLASTTASFVNLNISGTTASTNVLTGALTVAGGVGIQGDLNVGGIFSATGVTVNGQSVGYGYSGSVGPQGPIGYYGSTGPTGPQGPQGPLGYTGSAGYLGSTGFTGYDGSRGNIGYSGSRGFDGSQGFAGYNGSAGYWGSVGVTGFTGSQGNAGTSVVILGSVATAAALPGYPSSYTGSIGDGYIVSSTGRLWVWSGTVWNDVGLIVGPQGPLGYTGSSGATGPQGVPGYTGSGGYLGSAGANGYTGSAGNIGYTGSRGFDGSQGQVGYYGSVGSAGPSGPLGYTGSEGTAGYAGSVGSTTGTTTTFVISNLTSSTSTATGALQVQGGAGIAGDLYVGGNIYGLGGQAIGSNSTGTTSTFTILNTTSSTSTSTGALVVRGGVGIGQDVNIGGSLSVGSTASSGSITGVNSIVATNITVTGNLSAPNLAYSGGTFTTPIIIANTSASTSTTTGALQVAGGVGIGGDVNIGASLTVGTTASAGSISGVSSISAQNITVTGNLSAPNLTFSSGTFITPVVVANSATSTSTQSGAVIVSGGLGVGGTVYASSFITQGGLGSISGVAFLTTLNLTATNTVSVTGTGTSISTTTGALVVTGGVGIGGNVYVGGALYQLGQQVITTATIGNFTEGIGASTGTTSTFTISNTSSSTSTTTGALVVAGGVGIGGSVYIGTSSYIAGALIITTATIGNYAAGGGASTGTTSTFTISNTSSSTSTTTGALVVAGGAGIGGNLNVGGNIVGGGVRTSSTSTAPVNPTVGDIWYNTSTDDIYRYTSDGAYSYWLDITGPTVANSQGVTTQQPTFSAYAATGGQSLTGGAQTKISFSNENWDTAGAFNNTASPVTLNGLTVPAYSFCPPVAGYYQLTGMVQFNSSVFSCVDFFKNSDFGAVNGNRGELASAQGPMGSAIVYLNGVGDYVDMRVFVATTVSVLTQPGANYFQAAYLGTGVGYATAGAANPTMLAYRLNSALVGANVSTVQSIFGVGVTLESNTLYQFECIALLSKTAGATSSVFSILFGGTATFNNIVFTIYDNYNTTSFGLAGPNVYSVTASSASGSGIVTTGSAGSYHTIMIKGTASINAGGTFIPQYQMSVAPGGAYTTAVGSYMTLTPINSIQGTWA